MPASNSVIWSTKNNYPKGERVSLKQAFLITKDAIMALGTAFIIMFGVSFGGLRYE